MRKLAILNTHPIQYFAPLYRRLAQEPDLDVTVYYCSRQGAEAYFDEGFKHSVKWDVPLTDGYRAEFLPNLRSRGRVAGFWSLINPGIISELRRHSYDALMVGGHNHATYVIGMLAARVLGIPVLMRCDTHLLLHRSRLKRALRKPIMGFLYNHICSVCLAIGTRNREFYQYHNVPEERVKLVPFSVDNSSFIAAAEAITDRSAVRRKLGLPVGKPLILFASKLTARKRPMDLISAFNRISQQGIEAALAFVGSGELEPTLREYAARHKLEDVYFFGFQNQSELPNFYAAAELFVFPSENEPWGLVLNEVMCAGLPVVVTKEIGAVPDLVVNGSNGFLFDVGDVDQLAEHLLVLLRSPELRQKMGRESLRMIKTWDYDSCVKGIKQVLDRTTIRELRPAQHELT